MGEEIGANLKDAGAIGQVAFADTENPAEPDFHNWRVQNPQKLGLMMFKEIFIENHVSCLEIHPVDFECCS